MRKLQNDENTNLNEVFLLSERQCKNRYNIGRSKLLEIAKQSGSLIKIGSKNVYSRILLDNFFMSKAE